MEQQFSPKAAIITGSFSIILGIFILLIGQEAIQVDPLSVHSPLWVITCAGLSFILVGIAIINGYARKQGYGSLSQDFIALALVGIFLLIFGWIVFDPAPKNFIVSVPFYRGESSENVGRSAFGIAFVLTSAIFITVLVRIFRRITR